MKYVKDSTLSKLQAICDQDYGFRAVVIEVIKALHDETPYCGDAGFHCWSAGDLEEMLERLTISGPTGTQSDPPTKE